MSLLSYLFTEKHIWLKTNQYWSSRDRFHWSPCWNDRFRIWMSVLLHKITQCEVHEQNILSQHFIQNSWRALVGAINYLYLDRKHLAHVTTATELFHPLMPKWTSSVFPGTPGSLTLAETPLLCLAITHPRADLSLFSLYLLHMRLGFAYVLIHAALPGICNVSPFQAKRKKLLSFIADLKDFWHGTMLHHCTCTHRHLKTPLKWKPSV